MERFISLVETEKITSLKKSKIYDLMREGKFPKTVPVTFRRRAWLQSEIQTWIGERVQERENEQSRLIVNKIEVNEGNHP